MHRAGPSHQYLKNLAIALPIQIIAGRNRIHVAPEPGPHHHQLVRLVIRQRRQKSGVNDAENRGVRANAQRERQNCDGREAGIL